MKGFFKIGQQLKLRQKYSGTFFLTRCIMESRVRRAQPRFNQGCSCSRKNEINSLKWRTFEANSGQGNKKYRYSTELHLISHTIQRTQSLASVTEDRDNAICNQRFSLLDAYALRGMWTPVMYWSRDSYSETETFAKTQVSRHETSQDI